jgi:AcrR family transcriptional regulator
MPEPPAPLRTRRDVARNRARIIDAARRLVARDGLGVGHDAIAREAEVGVGTVYRHFPDRDELIDLIFDERIAEIEALAERVGAAEDPWAGLVGFIAGNLELQAGDRGLRELMAGAAQSAERVGRAQVRVGRAIGGLVERAHAAGQLRPDVEVGDLPLLHTMINAVVEQTREIAPELWRRSLALALDGYRAADLPRPPLPGAAPTATQVVQILANDPTRRRPPRSGDGGRTPPSSG